MHRCNLRLCMHPALDAQLSHLRPGDTSDNMRDRARCGRQFRPRVTLQFRELPRAEYARLSRALPRCRPRARAGRSR
jgi:hypothetical protein